MLRATLIGAGSKSGKNDAEMLLVAAFLVDPTRLEQVAIGNSNDGISDVAIGDRALSEIASIVSCQAPARFAGAQRFFWSRTTGGSAKLQVGFDTTSVSQITIGGVQGAPQTLGVASSCISALMYSLTGSSTLYSQSAARAAL